MSTCQGEPFWRAWRRLLYTVTARAEGTPLLERRLTWKDGHSTGIYTFGHLRQLCPCDTCRSEG